MTSMVDVKYEYKMQNTRIAWNGLLYPISTGEPTKQINHH